MGWPEAIAQSGFAILPDVFLPDEVDGLLESISRLKPRHGRAGVRHALCLAPVVAFAALPAMAEIARAALGPNAFPFRATLFDKSPQSNWLVVWHQDTALPLRSRIDLQGWGPWSVKEGIDYAHAPAATLSQVLAIRVCLDDSTVENGPLRILPETHLQGVLTDDDIHELATRISPVDCVVTKGGILAMRPLVVHASSKSQTDAPRRVLHIEYAASEAIAAPLELALA